MSEIRWAWRNIVARRWRAVLTIALLALALAATTIVFSAADSLVFRRVAYPSADRLVTFDTRMQSLEDQAAASRLPRC
jgi:hypothetical protein